MRRGGKCARKCLLGSLKIAQQADQRRQHLARFRAVNGIYHLTHVFDIVFAHLFGLSGLFGLSSLSGFLVHPGLFSSSIESFREIDQTDEINQIDQITVSA